MGWDGMGLGYSNLIGMGNIDPDGINEKGKQKLLTHEQLSKELISFL